jgi:hypothetical protein
LLIASATGANATTISAISPTTIAILRISLLLPSVGSAEVDPFSLHLISRYRRHEGGTSPK